MSVRKSQRPKAAPPPRHQVTDSEDGFLGKEQVEERKRAGSFISSLRKKICKENLPAEGLNQVPILKGNAATQPRNPNVDPRATVLQEKNQTWVINPQTLSQITAVPLATQHSSAIHNIASDRAMLISTPLTGITSTVTSNAFNNTFAQNTQFMNAIQKSVNNFEDDGNGHLKSGQYQHLEQIYQPLDISFNKHSIVHDDNFEADSEEENVSITQKQKSFTTTSAVNPTSENDDVISVEHSDSEDNEERREVIDIENLIKKTISEMMSLKFDEFKTELMRENENLIGKVNDNTDKKVQQLMEMFKKRNEKPTKPAMIPISNADEYKAFLQSLSSSQQIYEQVVEYLRFLCLGNAKDSVNDIIKEIFANEFCKHITYTGKQSELKIQDTPLDNAIYSALAGHNFDQPDKKGNFKSYVMTALENGKQRWRTDKKKVIAINPPVVDNPTEQNNA